MIYRFHPTFLAISIGILIFAELCSGDPRGNGNNNKRNNQNHGQIVSASARARGSSSSNFNPSSKNRGQNTFRTNNQPSISRFSQGRFFPISSGRFVPSSSEEWRNKSTNGNTGQLSRVPIPQQPQVAGNNRGQSGSYPQRSQSEVGKRRFGDQSAAVKAARSKLSEVPISDLRKGVAGSLRNMESSDRHKLFGLLRDPLPSNIESKLARGSPITENDLSKMDRKSLENLALLVLAYDNRKGGSGTRGTPNTVRGGSSGGTSQSTGGTGGSTGGTSQSTGGTGGSTGGTSQSTGGTGGSSSSSGGTSTNVNSGNGSSTSTDSNGMPTIDLTKIFTGGSGIKNIFSFGANGGADGGILGYFLGGAGNSGGGGSSLVDGGADFIQQLVRGLKNEDANFDFNEGDDVDLFGTDSDFDFGDDNFGDDF